MALASDPVNVSQASGIVLPSSLGNADTPVGTGIEGLLQRNTDQSYATEQAISSLDAVTRRLITMLGGTVASGSGSDNTPVNAHGGDVGSIGALAASVGSGQAYTSGALPVYIVGGLPDSFTPGSRQTSGTGAGGSNDPVGSYMTPPTNPADVPNAPPPMTSSSVAAQIHKQFKQGHSLQGIAQSLRANDQVAGMLDNIPIVGNATSALAEGSSATEALGGALGATGATAAMAVGGIGLAAGALDWAFNSGGAMLAHQRAENATFQSMEGGTNLGAIPERARQMGFEVSNWGQLTNAQSDAVFQGVTALGWKGGQRQQGLDFITQAYNNMGMNVTEGLNIVTVAAQNGVTNLHSLAGALQSVTDTAASASQNTELARQSFVGMYTAALGAGLGGNAASTTSAITQNILSAAGLVNQGVSSNFTSANIFEAAAYSGMTPGAYNAMLNRNPTAGQAALAGFRGQIAGDIADQFSSQTMATLGHGRVNESNINAFMASSGWSESTIANMYTELGGSGQHATEQGKAAFVLEQLRGSGPGAIDNPAAIRAAAKHVAAKAKAAKHGGGGWMSDIGIGSIVHDVASGAQTIAGEVADPLVKAASQAWHGNYLGAIVGGGDALTALATAGMVSSPWSAAESAFGGSGHGRSRSATASERTSAGAGVRSNQKVTVEISIHPDAKKTITAAVTGASALHLATTPSDGNSVYK